MADGNLLITSRPGYKMRERAIKKCEPLPCLGCMGTAVSISPTLNTLAHPNCTTTLRRLSTVITPVLPIRQLSHGQINDSLKVTQLGHMARLGFIPRPSGSRAGLLASMPCYLS